MIIAVVNKSFVLLRSNDIIDLKNHFDDLSGELELLFFGIN